jgi:GMP synthase (glutamine-hydrolysing)
MAATALALRHLDFEDLGILQPILQQHGYQIEYLDAGIDSFTATDLLAPELLIVLGGPISANDAHLFPFLEVEREGIAQRFLDDRPTLGICLGAQLMALAGGGRVTASPAVEIGYAPLHVEPASVLASLESVPVLHWHGETYTLPAGACTLASTPLVPQQAFAIGARQLGLQFHLEADSRRIERWLIGHSHELAAHAIDLDRLRSDAHEHGARLEAAASEVLAAWLGGLGTP